MEWRQTQNGLDFLPAPDKLWRRAATPICVRYSLLGIPLEVATNAPSLASLADDVFGNPDALDADGSMSPALAAQPARPGAQIEPMRLHIYLHDVSDPSAASGAPVI